MDSMMGICYEAAVVLLNKRQLEYILILYSTFILYNPPFWPYILSLMSMNGFYDGDVLWSCSSSIEQTSIGVNIDIVFNFHIVCMNTHFLINNKGWRAPNFCEKNSLIMFVSIWNKYTSFLYIASDFHYQKINRHEKL